MNIYIQKWNKEDVSWGHILADVLKKDYGIENCPEILRDSGVSIVRLRFFIFCFA